MFKKYRISPFSTSLILLLAFLLAACSAPRQLPESEIATVQMLEADIEFLSSDALEGRQVGTEGERKAAAYIAARMKDLGLKPLGTDGYYQDFNVKDSQNPHAVEFGDSEESTITGRNVVGLIDNSAAYTVVIGAHYDHLGYGTFGSLSTDDGEIHNGADDNASGVAGMLYLANTLQSCCEQYNYLFIAFSGEERGLWGSNYFTSNPSLSMGDVNFMINMDMIGRMNEDKSLAIYGNGTSPAWDGLIEEANVEALKLSLKPSGIGPSDHTSFYLEDIPVLHFFTGQHEDYHKPTDDADKINYTGMTSVLQMIKTIITQASDMDKLTFSETSEEESQTRRSFKVTLGVIPDYLYDGIGMRIDGVRPGRPAANAGIEDGDIVIKMGDIPIETMESYMTALSQFEPGQAILVVIQRGDDTLEKEVRFD